MAWQYDDPQWVRLDQCFVLLTSALFVASVLSWCEVPVFGSDPPFRLGSVFLSGALLLQAVSAVFVRRRLDVVSYSVLALSMACLWSSVTAR